MSYLCQKSITMCSSIYDKEPGDGIFIASSSWEGDKPGIKAQEIRVTFTKDVFETGDLLTYDYRMGEQLRVLSKEGETLVCDLSTIHPDVTWIPPGRLEPGVQYYKIGNTIKGFGHCG